MRNLLVAGLILAQILLQPTMCFSGGSYTGSFTLFVNIPAIIGLNVPDPNQQIKTIDTKFNMGDKITSNTQTELTQMKIVRNHQNIILKTLVVR